MYHWSKITLSLFSITLTACTAYELPPLAANHPAHPTAEAGWAWPSSRTLAYTPADVPVTVPMAAAAPGHQGHGDVPQGEGAGQRVMGEGKVVATVPDANQLVVEHGEIKGFMEAMTMGYRIDPPSLMEGLKFGDKIRFTIDVQKKAIVKIEKMK